MKCVLALLLSVMSSAALAQTTGAVDPNPAPAQPSASEEVPRGGCMPIGLTASGEMVFPILCKEFIERRRGMTTEQNPAAVDEKPASVEEKPAALEEKSITKQAESVAIEQSKQAIKPVESVPMPKRVESEPRGHAISSDDCTRYRTYDPASGSYRGYDGRRRTCKYFK
jgi:hypothetical protein